MTPYGSRPVPLNWGDILVTVGIAAILFLGVNLAVNGPQQLVGPIVSLDPLALPYYGLLSLLRMISAYLLSLAFTLVYGYAAARNRRAEMILLPILDILQSVPILSFLPVVVLALVSIAPAGLGVELAAIVLIFTSMAWNMTFAFYQSLVTIPKEMLEAAGVFRLVGWFRFRSVELPFATIALVWNSMVSWAGGWFFLMAAEQFVLGDRNFQLLGLGSYLKTAAEAGNVPALLFGLVTLAILIVAVDQLFWRPVIAWADKFKLQTVSEAEPPRSWLLDVLSRSILIERFSESVLSLLSDRVDQVLGRFSATRVESDGRAGKGGLGLVGTVFLLVVAVVVAYGGVRAIILIAEVSPSQWLLVGASALATFLRVIAALILALVWTLPVGVAIGLNHKLANRLMPIVQVTASVPATALFPVLLFFLISLAGGLDIAAVLLMLLGTQWYLLFNIIAGANAISDDLKYTTESLGIRGVERWRSFIIPAIFPFLVTGLITATGGAWNASVVAEYVTFGGQTEQTLGLGALIALSSQEANYPLLLTSTLTMVVIVIAINRLLWRRLSTLAEERFHLD